MKLATYLCCLPPKNKNKEKEDILNNFSMGVAYRGDQVEVVSTSTLIRADAALMVGWVHENSKQAPHLVFRKQILDYQAANGNHTIIADSNLFLYKDISNTHHYLRYSLDGIFPNTGNYCDNNTDHRRWEKFSARTGIQLKNYRKNGNHILLCLQRNGGWSMGGFDVVDWTAETIKTLRKYTDRDIVIRPHPGDKDAERYLSPKNLMKKIPLLKGVKLSQPTSSLLDDLVNCWAVVNYNSSPTVGAAIEGFPVFVTDAERSQCKEIANTDLSTIENPIYPNRQPWVERLAMFHWNFEETTSGECWDHLKNYL
jgi:hypothetical protein